MSFSEIPSELKERDQWLMWDSSSDTPRRPHWRGDFGVSWNDPDDWHSFDEAVGAAEERDSWGIGYVLAAGNDDYARGIYGGLDLDGCIAEDGGPKDWLPSMQPFFDADTYIERSASGEGFHVLFAGFEPPEWWSDVAVAEHEGVEAYGSKFFVFTGDRLEGAGATISDTGDYAVEWLQEAYEEIRGERPWETEEDDSASLDEYEPSAATGNAEDIARAVNRLDARDVADQTIVHAWNDDHTASGDNRAFYPTWGPNCNGTANIVDEDGWTDTGTNSASGGPLEMAAIGMGELSHRGCSWGDVEGEMWWDAVDHLRDLGFPIPEYESDDAGHRQAPEPEPEPESSGETESSSASRSPRGSPNWDSIRAKYADDELDDKYPRQDAARRILSEHEFATPRDTERLWEYYGPDGVFEKGGEATVDEILARHLGAHYSQREKNEVIGYIKARTYVDREEFNGGEDENLLCVANGVLDLETRELYEHSPDYYFVRALQVEYDPDAEAENVEQFLDEITERDADKQTMLEMVGASLWPAYLKGKFMILFGEGGNGKSVFFDLVSRFLGPENVSGWDLQDLGENRFATSALVGKFANIGGDMDSVKVKNTGTLKKLTGGDQMMVEEKNEKAHEFVNSATLMFGANRPPVIDEASKAVKRRLVPIRLPYEFTEDEEEIEERELAKEARDPDVLLQEMTTAEEKSGLLNLALDGLDRLRDEGDVSLPESQQERLEYYEQFSDPIKEFAVRCLDNERNQRVEKDAVYSAYKGFCQDRDYTNRQKSTFFRQLGRTTFDVNSVRTGSDGDRTQMLDNAMFTDTGEVYAPDYHTDTTRSGDDSDTAEGDSPTLEDLQPGRHDLEVTVAEMMDPKPWQQARGHVVDDSGNIMQFVAEGTNNPVGHVEEDDRVKITKAKVATDRDGILQIEISGVCDVTVINRDAEQAGLDDGGGGGGNEAAADGGEPESDDQAADSPGGTNVREKCQRLAEEIVGDGTFKQIEIQNMAADRFEWDLSTTKQLIEKACELGYLENIGGNEYRSV
jgi:putative DNA primase/helicase